MDSVVSGFLGFLIGLVVYYVFQRLCEGGKQTPSVSDSAPVEKEQETSDSEIQRQARKATVQEGLRALVAYDSPDLKPPQLPQIGDDLGTTVDDGFENLNSNLDTIEDSLMGLQNSPCGVLVKKECDYLLDLVDDCKTLTEVIEVSCSAVANQVTATRQYLMEAQQDDELLTEEREVAKWITSAFMKTSSSHSSPYLPRVNPLKSSDTSIGSGGETPLGQLMSSSGLEYDSQSTWTFDSKNSDRSINSEEDLKTLDLSEMMAQQDSNELHVTDTKLWKDHNELRTHPEVLEVLEKLGTWEFDVFAMDALVDTLTLPLCAEILISKLDSHNFVNPVNIPVRSVFDYCLKLTRLYYPRKQVPYHNILHATDVMCGTFYLCTSNKFDGFEYVNILSVLLAAAAHDVEHDGFNNTFHINTSSQLALRYNDKSVLENHHCAVGWKTIRQTGILDAIPPNKRPMFRKVFVSSILATDMTSHGERLLHLEKISNEKSSHNSVKMLGHVLHTADISNVAKPFDYCYRWVELVMQEFFNQGDREKSLGIPVSPLCDRDKIDIDSSEVGFVKFVVKPWYKQLQLVLPDVCDIGMANINLNYREFKDRALKCQQENHPKMKKGARTILLANKDTRSRDCLNLTLERQEEQKLRRTLSHTVQGIRRRSLTNITHPNVPRRSLTNLDAWHSLPSMQLHRVSDSRSRDSNFLQVNTNFLQVKENLRSDSLQEHEI